MKCKYCHAESGGRFHWKCNEELVRRIESGVCIECGDAPVSWDGSRSCFKCICTHRGRYVYSGYPGGS